MTKHLLLFVLCLAVVLAACAPVVKPAVTPAVKPTLLTAQDSLNSRIDSLAAATDTRIKQAEQRQGAETFGALLCVVAVFLLLRTPGK